jgi:hypothetical protein
MPDDAPMRCNPLHCAIPWRGSELKVKLVTRFPKLLRFLSVNKLNALRFRTDRAPLDKAEGNSRDAGHVRETRGGDGEGCGIVGLLKLVYRACDRFQSVLSTWDDLGAGFLLYHGRSHALAENATDLDAIGKLDGKRCLLEWETSSSSASNTVATPDDP